MPTDLFFKTSHEKYSHEVLQFICPFMTVLTINIKELDLKYKLLKLGKMYYLINLGVDYIEGAFLALPYFFPAYVAVIVL